MKTISKIIASIIVVSTLFNCAGGKDNAEDADHEQSIFPKGQIGSRNKFHR